MGKKLTIYMLDGTPTGAMTVEIGNWSGKAVFAPRGVLKKTLERSEFESPGVYFLKSESDDADFDGSIYIGEAEELRARLKTHVAERDFESMICFLSKDELLTKAHIKFLESRLIALTKDANTSQIENSTHPKLSKISEADISDMEYFIDQIKLVLPAVGIRSLVSSVRTTHLTTPTTTQSVVYSIKSPSLKAQMIEAEDGFVVLKGSEASKDVSDSISPGRVHLRTKLLDAGTLVLKNDRFVFTEDTLFNSTSEASSVVLGRQSAGPLFWIDPSGITYKENQ